MTRPAVRTVLAAAFAAVACWPGPPAPAEEPKEPAPDAALARALAVEAQVVQTLAKVRPATVSVLCKTVPDASAVAKADADPKEPPQAVLSGCGSGVVVMIENRPWVITNDHVARGADVLEVVTLDGTSHPVELADSVAGRDIALLRFTERTAGIRGVPVLTRASREISEGRWVIATGNPFFLATDGRSVATLGVVSGLGRVLGTGQVYGNAVQHDAAVNPGNSGGPLWNLDGELVGINGMIVTRGGGGGAGPSNTGASFSIPVHQIESYLKALRDQKTDAEAGFLGLGTETAKDAGGTPRGALVVSVDPKSPVREDGESAILPGDVVTALVVRGKLYTISTSTELVNELAGFPAGTVVKVKYLRRERAGQWTGKLGTQR